jgi:hypothetical protein
MASFASRARILACFAAVALIALSMAGCNRVRGEGTITGQVLVDGKPLRGGTVRFVPVASGVNSLSAEIDESGNFGPLVMPAGEVMISVDNRTLAPRAPRAAIPLPKNTNPEVQAKMMARGGGAAPPPNPRYVPIPTRYHAVETSDLKYTVVPGEQKHNVELSSK